MEDRTAVFRDLPYYKAIWKECLKKQIGNLLQELSAETGEESVIIMANITTGTSSCFGSDRAKGFIETSNDVKKRFLSHCLKSCHLDMLPGRSVIKPGKRKFKGDLKNKKIKQPKLGSSETDMIDNTQLISNDSQDIVAKDDSPQSVPDQSGLELENSTNNSKTGEKSDLCFQGPLVSTFSNKSQGHTVQENDSNLDSSRSDSVICIKTEQPDYEYSPSQDSDASNSNIYPGENTDSSFNETHGSVSFSESPGENEGQFSSATPQPIGPIRFCIQAQPSTRSGFSFSGTTPLSTATPSSTSSLPKPNGFSFGLSTTSTVQPASGGFSFGNTPSATATSLPTVPTTASSGVLFGSSACTTTSATPTAVGFGMSTKPTPSTTSAPGGFSFNTQSKNPSLTTGFPFDGTANLGLTSGLSGSSASTGGFPFGGTGSSAASTGLTTGVSGSIVPTTGFSFGSAGSSTSNAGLTTGVQGSKISTTGFSFGGAGSTANTGLTTGVQGSIVPTTGFSFGGAGSSAPSTGLTSSTAATGGFSFDGTGSSSSAKAIGGFSFGPSTTATVMAVAQPLYFQTTTASTGVFGSTAPTSGFAFGSKPTTTSVTSLFGSSPAVTTQSLFATPFGAAATPSSTPFSFGATKTTAQFSINTGSTNTTAGSSAPFSFGVGSTASTTGSSQPASGLFQFGGAPNTAAPAFGTPATQTGSVFGTTGQAPAFGSSSQTPAFGATNPPAFGSSNQTSVFGSANQPPAFGASANQTAFGSATPSFGASTNQTTGFGSATPTFGASATPTFGASANQKPATPAFGGAFGSGGGAGTGFAKSHSMPVFNTVPDSSTNTGTFNFGAPAPNVNPFGQGQVTPAKQTGAAFGQMSNDMTPKAQTGAMFSFGQSNNNSSASKGFDFSASTNPGGAANAGGFNFMAASSVPVFNFGSMDATPSGTPGFGSTSSTPGTFAMGSAPPRTNRTMARASRRRPTRK